VVTSRAVVPEREVRSALTTRAAVLGLVVCMLVLSAALPLREYLSQRSDIAAVRAAQAAQRARVAGLDKQLAQLQDPAYVRSQARARLHFVLPGETAYVVLSPSAAPEPAQSAAPGPPSGPEAPWYSQVWGTVLSADSRPTAPPAPPLLK